MVLIICTIVPKITAMRIKLIKMNKLVRSNLRNLNQYLIKIIYNNKIMIMGLKGVELRRIKNLCLNLYK